MIDIHDRPAVEALRRQLRLDPHPLRRFRGQFYKQQRPIAAALAELPPPARAAFVADVRPHHLTLVRAVDSTNDGATKLIFRTHDDLEFETVILRVKTGRVALCVSSQVGCAAACRFCATGQLGLRRNLEPGEILDQVIQANQRLLPEGHRVRNIVFMGMGEPFHNERALETTLDVLTDPACFEYSPLKISVSTVGIPDAMRRLATRHPRVRQALSLHSAVPTTREKLIPLAARYPLPALRAAIADVTAQQGRAVMLEHLLLADCNDGAADLDALDAFACGLDVHINLIPYNAIPGAEDLRPTARPTREAFANELKARGHKVTLRYSLGADITAACGQLVRAADAR